MLYISQVPLQVPSVSGICFQENVFFCHFLFIRGGVTWICVVIFFPCEQTLLIITMDFIQIQPLNLELSKCKYWTTGLFHI